MTLDPPNKPLTMDLPPAARGRGPGWTPRRLRALSSRVCPPADLIFLGAAYLGALLVPLLVHGRHETLSEFLQLRVSLRNLIVAGMCVSTWRVVLLTLGVYSPQRTRSLLDYVFRCFIALNSCAAVVGLIEVVLRQRAIVWQVVAIFWLVSLVLTAGLRAALLAFDRLLRSRFRGRRGLLVVGSGERARLLFEELKIHREWGYSLVGFVETEPQRGHVPAALILGGISALENVLLSREIDEVIVALPIESQFETVGSVIAICQMLGTPVQYFTDFFGSSTPQRRP